MAIRCPIRRVLLCLPLGLVTTIAIAWLSAAYIQLRWDGAEPRSIGREPLGTPYAVQRFVAFGAERILWSTFEFNYRPGLEHQVERFDLEKPYTALPLFVRAGLLPPWWGRTPHVSPTDSADSVWALDARGWPLPALGCEWTPEETESHPVDGGIALAPWLLRWIDFGAEDSPRGRFGFTFILVRALPYWPIPLGLAADTLLFALAWFILLYAPGDLRRTLRLRRGLCPRCAYNLAGLPPNSPCPECGHTKETRQCPSSPTGGGAGVLAGGGGSVSSFPTDPP